MRMIAASLALVVVLSAPAPSGSFQARVVGVSDGDTLTVLAAGNRQVKVRLYGIDSPETGQDFGAKAKQATSQLAFGQTVEILPRDTDRYGRTVAEVRLRDGRSLNRELVRDGWAWWYRDFAKGDRELERLEAEARAAGRGLWSQPGATPPWEWRRGGPAVVAAGVVANRKSGIYHAANCRAAATMKPENRQTFKTPREAEQAGFRHAKGCK